MGNVAAVLIVLAGVFLVIVGIRGTQGAVFGGLFGQGGTNTTATIPGTFPNEVQPPSSGGGGSSTGGGGGSGVFVK